MKNTFPILLIIFFVSNSYADEKVNVKTVISGDEFYATYKGEEKKIQFLDVDAPEMKQAWGREAKTYLEKNIKGKTVTLKDVEESVLTIYAEIYLTDGTDLAVEILKTGNGWYNENKSLRKDLAKHQTEARQKKTGLWSSSTTPVAPWLYRKNPSKYPHAEAPQEYEERKKAAQVKSQQDKVSRKNQTKKQIISPAEAIKAKEEKESKATSGKPKKVIPRKNQSIYLHRNRIYTTSDDGRYHYGSCRNINRDAKITEWDEHDLDEIPEEYDHCTTCKTPERED